MNIVFVTSSFGCGGAEKMLFFLADGLIKKHHNVTILNLDLTKEYDMCLRYDVPNYIANIPYRGSLRTNFDWIKFVCRNAKRLQAHILIGFLEHGNFCAATAGKILKIPSIISERGDPFTTFKNLSKSSRFKLNLINRANGAVFQTPGASNFYSLKLQSNCAVIPNPIFINENVSGIQKYDTLPHSVISIGRIDNKQKRIDIALESFKLFHSTHKDYQFLIYGEGPDKNYLIDYSIRLGLEPYVKFEGKTSEPLSCLSKGGIFLITSDYEGISNSLLEAMAIGLPVVSTDHSPGGARFLINDHKNGLLAPMRDSTTIAQCLAEFADNKTLAEECGMHAKDVLRRFSPENSVNAWEKYISQVIRKYRE